MASFIIFGVRKIISSLDNNILLRSSLFIKQLQQGHFEVNGRYVAVNASASTISARITDSFGVNTCISFFTTKCMSLLFDIGDNNILRHL